MQDPINKIDDLEHVGKRGDEELEAVRKENSEKEEAVKRIEENIEVESS